MTTTNAITNNNFRLAIQQISADPSLSSQEIRAIQFCASGGKLSDNIIPSSLGLGAVAQLDTITGKCLFDGDKAINKAILSCHNSKNPDTQVQVIAQPVAHSSDPNQYPAQLAYFNDVPGGVALPYQRVSLNDVGWFPYPSQVGHSNNVPGNFDQGCVVASNLTVFNTTTSYGNEQGQGSLTVACGVGKPDPSAFSNPSSAAAYTNQVVEVPAGGAYATVIQRPSFNIDYFDGTGSTSMSTTMKKTSVNYVDMADPASYYQFAANGLAGGTAVLFAYGADPESDRPEWLYYTGIISFITSFSIPSASNAGTVQFVADYAYTNTAGELTIFSQPIAVFSVYENTQCQSNSFSMSIASPIVSQNGCLITPYFFGVRACSYNLQSGDSIELACQCEIGVDDPGSSEYFSFVSSYGFTGELQFVAKYAYAAVANPEQRPLLLQQSPRSSINVSTVECESWRCLGNGPGLILLQSEMASFLNPLSSISARQDHTMSASARPVDNHSMLAASKPRWARQTSAAIDIAGQAIRTGAQVYKAVASSRDKPSLPLKYFVDVLRRMPHKNWEVRHFMKNRSVVEAALGPGMLADEAMAMMTASLSRNEDWVHYSVQELLDLFADKSDFEASAISVDPEGSHIPRQPELVGDGDVVPAHSSRYKPPVEDKLSKLLNRHGFRCGRTVPPKLFDFVLDRASHSDSDASTPLITLAESADRPRFNVGLCVPRKPRRSAVKFLSDPPQGYLSHFASTLRAHTTGAFFSSKKADPSSYVPVDTIDRVSATVTVVTPEMSLCCLKMGCFKTSTYSVQPGDSVRVVSSASTSGEEVLPISEVHLPGMVCPFTVTKFIQSNEEHIRDIRRRGKPLVGSKKAKQQTVSELRRHGVRVLGSPSLAASRADEFDDDDLGIPSLRQERDLGEASSEDELSEDEAPPSLRFPTFNTESDSEDEEEEPDQETSVAYEAEKLPIELKFDRKTDSSSAAIAFLCDRTPPPVDAMGACGLQAVEPGFSQQLVKCITHKPVKAVSWMTSTFIAPTVMRVNDTQQIWFVPFTLSRVKSGVHKYNRPVVTPGSQLKIHLSEAFEIDKDDIENIGNVVRNVNGVVGDVYVQPSLSIESIDHGIVGTSYSLGLWMALMGLPCLCAVTGLVAADGSVHKVGKIVSKCLGFGTVSEDIPFMVIPADNVSDFVACADGKGEYSDIVGKMVPYLSKATDEVASCNFGLGCQVYRICPVSHVNAIINFYLWGAYLEPIRDCAAYKEWSEANSANLKWFKELTSIQNTIDEHAESFPVLETWRSGLKAKFNSTKPFTPARVSEALAGIIKNLAEVSKRALKEGGADSAEQVAIRRQSEKLSKVKVPSQKAEYDAKKLEKAALNERFSRLEIEYEWNNPETHNVEWVNNTNYKKSMLKNLAGKTFPFTVDNGQVEKVFIPNSRPYAPVRKQVVSRSTWAKRAGAADDQFVGLPA